MYYKINQFKLNTQEENSLSLKQLQKGNDNSIFFRNLLISKKYKKFNGKQLKGDLCYDAYYKDFLDGDDLKYTIYCYCYDLKELVENPEIFEFSFEVQIETERGIIGFEAIQWDFRTPQRSIKNLEFFESKAEIIWKTFGSKKFPK